MRLRDSNIIVCDCGAELNPEIVTATDFIMYVDGTATCSNCGASGEIVFPKEDIPLELGPSIEDRVDGLEDAMLFII